MSNQPGTQHSPGSPEDIKQTLENLQQFIAEKLKAIQLHQAGAAVAGTSPTRSVCHVDGTTDGD